MSDVLIETVVVRTGLTAAGTWTSNIDVKIQPDEMVVRYVHYFHNASEPFISLVRSSLTNGYICSITDGPAGSNQDLTFQFKPETTIRGNYDFGVYDITGATDVARAGSLAIFLEFRQYKKKK